MADSDEKVEPVTEPATEAAGEQGAEPILLSGRGQLFTLKLRIGGTNGQWKSDLTLERLSDVAARLDAVGTRIQELGKASDNRDGV